VMVCGLFAAARRASSVIQRRSFVCLCITWFNGVAAVGENRIATNKETEENRENPGPGNLEAPDTRNPYLAGSVPAGSPSSPAISFVYQWSSALTLLG
jgi:hypothetical protein